MSNIILPIVQDHTVVTSEDYNQSQDGCSLSLDGFCGLVAYNMQQTEPFHNALLKTYYYLPNTPPVVMCPFLMLPRPRPVMY